MRTMSGLFRAIIFRMDGDEIIAKRIIELACLERDWGDVELLYGKEATHILKDIVPTDPLLLYNMTVFSYKSDGKTKKEIEKLLEGYTHADWLKDMERFATIIQREKRLALAKMKKKA